MQNGKFSESLEKPLDLCYNQTAGNVFGNLIKTTGEPLTIKDIARLAGCGVSTVSRALNGSNEISEQTKERINEVIRQYNYTPNGNARRMRRSAEKTILLIVNGSSNLFFSPLIEQIQIAASSAGFQIAVNHIDEQEDEEKLIKTLKMAGLYEDAMKLENKLDTTIFKSYDENGTELSGGQQQKTAICRALYRDSPIVILDEPTAALDPVAEYEIYKHFNKLVGGKTAIYISHRLSSCKFCDEIAVFADDTIKEYGTHDELVKIENGIYSEMYNAQAQYYVENVS